MRVNFDIKLSKSQKDVYSIIHDYKYKYITVVFSRQSGKTTLMEVLVVEWLLKKGIVKNRIKSILILDSSIMWLAKSDFISSN